MSFPWHIAVSGPAPPTPPNSGGAGGAGPGIGPCALWVHLAAFALCLLLAGAPALGATAAQVRDWTTALQAQRSPTPVFTERFTIDLRQWGLPLLLGHDGLVLHRTEGTIPGARQLFVPGLILHDGVIECEVRLEADDQAYLMFRAQDDADAAYQLLVTTRTDGSYVTGFVKKHNLEQLYGGACVGETYRESYPAGQWLRLAVYFRGRSMAALVNGEPAAHYDRSEVRDGSVSLFCGSRPLAVRRLVVYAFPDALPASPPKPPRVRGGWGEPSVGPPKPPRVRGGWGGRPQSDLPRPPEDAPRSFLGPGVPPAGPPEAHSGIAGGTVPGAGGRVHRWRIEAGGRFLFDGEELVPLRDTDTLYLAQLPGSVDQQRAVRSIADPGAADALRRGGLPYPPVRVRLVDYINTCATDHELSDEPVLAGASRLLDVGGRRYRATSWRRWLSYFAYTLRTDSPMAPHLLLAETPNDRERFLTLRIQPPDGTGADPEYGTGAGTYTGHGLPADGKPFNQALLFLPRSERIRFTVSRLPGEEGRDANSGAAVSQVFLFALVDPPSSRPNPVFPPIEQERTLALAVPSARALLRQCGAYLDSPNAPAADRAAGYRAFAHHLRFLGFNGLDLGVLDPEGGGSAEYPDSRLFEVTDRGALSELLPLAEGLGIRVTPVLPPLPLANLRADAAGQAAKCALVDREDRLSSGTLDLLHPEGARLALQWLSEVCPRYQSRAVREIALRVEGDEGGCIPRSGETAADGVGYSDDDIARFTSETGIDVPAQTAAEAYAWLREHAWERWIDWRCETLYRHWLLARNIVRTAAPDARLVLKLALPDREIARPDLWFEEKRTPLDLLRAHGFDPRLFADVEGIVLERVLDVGYDRMRSCRHHENAGALESWDYQAGLAELYRSGEGNAVEVSIVPWEEWGQHLGSEFYPRAGGHWGASVVTPWGRHLFRPLTTALRLSDPCRVSVSSVELATAGREPEWRRFARAYRALPAVPAAAFDGTVAMKSPAGGVPADLVVRAHGDRLAVINDSGQARQVELRPSRPLRRGERWVDLATGRTLAQRKGYTGSLVLDLDPFDLRTLALLPDVPAARR